MLYAAIALSMHAVLYAGLAVIYVEKDACVHSLDLYGHLDRRHRGSVS